MLLHETLKIAFKLEIQQTAVIWWKYKLECAWELLYIWVWKTAVVPMTLWVLAIPCNVAP